MAKKQFKVSIMGDKWDVILLSGKEFKTMFGPGIIAMCCYGEGKRELYFKPSGVSLQTCAHEVFHAFRSYQLTDNINMTPESTEELHADMYAWHYKAMAKATLQIYRGLKYNEL